MTKGLLILVLVCYLALPGFSDEPSGAPTGLAASVQNYTSDKATTQFQLNTGSFELDTNWSFEREGATSELTGASQPESLGLVFHPYGSSVLGYREEGEDTRTLQLSLPKQQFNLTRTLQGHGASTTETWSSELALGSRTKLGFRGSPAASGSDVFTLTSSLGQGKSFDARWSNSTKIEKSFAYMQKSSRSNTGLTYSQLQGSQLLGAAYNRRTADGVIAVLAQRDSVRGELWELAYTPRGSESLGWDASIGSVFGSPTYKVKLDTKPVSDLLLQGELAQSQTERKARYGGRTSLLGLDFNAEVALKDTLASAGLERRDYRFELEKGRLELGFQRDESPYADLVEDTYTGKLRLFNVFGIDATASGEWAQSDNLLTSRLELARSSLFQLTIQLEQNEYNDQEDWEFGLQLGGSKDSKHRLMLQVEAPEDERPQTEVQYRYETSLW